MSLPWKDSGLLVVCKSANCQLTSLSQSMPPFLSSRKSQALFAVGNLSNPAHAEQDIIKFSPVGTLLLLIKMIGSKWNIYTYTYRLMGKETGPCLWDQHCFVVNAFCPWSVKTFLECILARQQKLPIWANCWLYAEWGSHGDWTLYALMWWPWYGFLVHPWV